MAIDFLNQITVTLMDTRDRTSTVGRTKSFCTHRALHLFSATLLCVAILAPVQQAKAQEMTLSLDAGLMTGAQLGQSGDSTVVLRQPTAIVFDGAAVFDDELVEWSLGIVMQMEAPIAAALYPKVRLLRPRGDDAFYAQVGIPWYLSPFRRFGVGVGGGYRHQLEEGFYFFTQGSTEFYFAGGDIPSGESIITFSVVAGGRLTF